MLGKSSPFPSAKLNALKPLLLVNLNEENLSLMQQEENAFYESATKSFLDNSIAILLALLSTHLD